MLLFARFHHSDILVPRCRALLLLFLRGNFACTTLHLDQAILKLVLLISVVGSRLASSCDLRCTTRWFLSCDWLSWLIARLWTLRLHHFYFKFIDNYNFKCLASNLNWEKFVWFKEIDLLYLCRGRLEIHISRRKSLGKKKNDISRIRTCAGEPNGFRVHPLNHSGTMSESMFYTFFTPIKQLDDRRAAEALRQTPVTWSCSLPLN